MLSIFFRTSPNCSFLSSITGSIHTGAPTVSIRLSILIILLSLVGEGLGLIIIGI